MKALQPEVQCHEFCFPRRDTLLLVEVTGGAVVIHATGETFSGPAKHRFTRELVAEGFIPDRYEWLSFAEPGSFSGLQWVVDRSWLAIGEAVRAPARRFMQRLIAMALLVWVGLMAALLQGWLGSGAFFVASKSGPPLYSPASPSAGQTGPRGPHLHP